MATGVGRAPRQCCRRPQRVALRPRRAHAPAGQLQRRFRGDDGVPATRLVAVDLHGPHGRQQVPQVVPEVGGSRPRGRRQQVGEGDLALVVELVLVTEEDDLVLEQGRTDARHRLGGQVGREVGSLDQGADPPTELGDGEIGGDGVDAVQLRGHA